VLVLLIYLSCVWIAGIWLGYWLNLPLLLCLAGLVPLPLLFFIRRHRKPIILASAGIIVLIAAAVYSYSSLYSIDESRIHFYNDRGTAEIKGMVAGDPDIRDKNTRLTLSAEAIRLNSGWREVRGIVLVFVPRYPAYSYGDVLRVTGELKTPPRLGDFDYRGYLAHQGIYATMLYPEIEVLDAGQGFKPLAWIYSLRGRLAQTLAEALPEPQASLAQGIVLGIRGNIPEDLNSDFTRSGTAHLLAISGFNLSIMAGVLLSIGLWLFGRRHYLYVWLALSAIWLYTVITGMNPPVVRGAVMASLFLLAEALGRQRSGMVALTFAAAVMVGISPCILGDASFQLSFLAMAGLIFIYPILREPGRRIAAARLGDEGTLASIANVTIDTFSACLGAVIAVWPLVAYYFGIFSLVGPLATFLATPALTVIIVTGTLTGILGLASLMAAQVLGWLAWTFLSYMILVASGLAAPSLSSIEVGSISPSFIVGYYVVLAAAIWSHNRWKRLRNLMSGAAGVMKAGISLPSGILRNVKLIIVPLLLLAVLVSYTAATMPDDELHVSFLDVGEGDAIFIQKGNQQVLIDGGPGPQAIDLGLSRGMPFWDRTIDLLVLTHPHSDHLAGLVEVLRRYRVGQVLYPSLDCSSPLFGEWLRLIEEKGIKSTIACAGQQIDMGNDVVMKVLNPPANPVSGSESDLDNNGVVLYLRDGKISFLLAADIMRDTEWELIRERADLSATVLKVAHHGSRTSTTPEFLAVVNPRVAVISCGAENKSGHPHEEVVCRLGEKAGGENIYRTDEQGTIEFTTDGERLWVEAGNQ
jgi:competence protein ComEC